MPNADADILTRYADKGALSPAQYRDLQPRIRRYLESGNEGPVEKLVQIMHAMTGEPIEGWRRMAQNDGRAGDINYLAEVPVWYLNSSTYMTSKPSREYWLRQLLHGIAGVTH